MIAALTAAEISSLIFGLVLALKPAPTIEDRISLMRSNCFSFTSASAASFAHSPLSAFLLISRYSLGFQSRPKWLYMIFISAIESSWNITSTPSGSKLFRYPSILGCFSNLFRIREMSFIFLKLLITLGIALRFFLIL